MDVRSIEAMPLTPPVLAQPAAAVSPVRAAKPHANNWTGENVDTVDFTASALKEALSSPDDVKVAVHRRSDGHLLITLYDSASGQVIAQMPPESVVAAIDKVLKDHARKK